MGTNVITRADFMELMHKARFIQEATLGIEFITCDPNRVLYIKVGVCVESRIQSI